MHKRLFNSISRRGSQENGDKGVDSPESTIARGVRLFCESGGPNNTGEEVLHLPAIVDSAESSPAAASEAARIIRKFLSRDNYQRAYVQYNAVMLIRILADNPGKSFTKNLDGKFVTTVKELLRDGRDMSVQQMLRETLDNFQTQKSDDESLAPLLEMWKKEKDKMFKRASMVTPRPMQQGGPMPNYQQQQVQQQNYFSRPHRPRNTLPPPAELAQRIEEARTSAKLLSQLVGTTPPTELLGNELIKEFVERCQSASRSVQQYIHADSPPPDEDTLLTLIETNDQLATAQSRYQRAMLEARKRTGVVTPTPSPNPPAMNNRGSLFEAPSDYGASLPAPPPGPPPGRQPLNGNPQDAENPFGDHNESSNSGTANLQPPLQPHDYGLPPQGVVGPQYGSGQAFSNTRILESDSDEHEPRREVEPQPAKPKYRF